MPKELQLGGRRMLAAVGQPCPYCTETMIEGDLKRQPTRDHILPRSRGGPKGRRAGRWVVVCSECNFNKRDMTLEEFLLYLIKKNSDLCHNIDRNIAMMRCIKYLIDIGLE